MKKLLYLIPFLLIGTLADAQDTAAYKLRLSFSLIDLPQNLESYGNFPSTMQSVEISNNLYDLSFWGIDALGNEIIRNRKKTTVGNIANKGLKYVLGFAFSYFGSELPIPLGVYTHEEFHRSVLGVNGYAALNGNWVLNRWEGTVYGLTDEDLSQLKKNNSIGLLYSYVSGVQSETYATQVNLIQDFHNRRTFYKNPFYLYNAYYVWNYFRFSASSESDSVKVNAPEHEDANPYYRDYAGSDLTAWIYDMFSPDSAYTSRDGFPGGEGVNRRIGFADLTQEGQDYLKKQKNLALLNFANPAIFMINRIKVTADFSFLLFLQYSPTHFGNDIALYIPFQYKSNNHVISIHQYNNCEKEFLGVQYGISGITPFSGRKLNLGGTVQLWSQPENQNFYDHAGTIGGAFEVMASYPFGKGFSSSITAGYKTEGWIIGNPYIEERANFRVGVRYDLIK